MDIPASPSKKTSRELAGTLRNLKKVEQALQLVESAQGAAMEEEDEEPYTTEDNEGSK